MRFGKILIIMGLIFLTGCGLVKELVKLEKLPEKPITQIEKELRGAWVTRFNWTHQNPDTMRNRIHTIMEKLGNANFNAVFFQVRGQAETLYPSPIETWSKLVGYQDPGYDPVQLAIKEAHKNGLKFYAYINLLPLWNEDQPPEDKDHLYYQHGPEVESEQSWICFEKGGKPMIRNEYYYLNPALPEVKTYLKKVIRHFVSNYNVDGLHFDRIRYPGSKYLYDPYTLQKFKKDSLKNPLTRAEWARKTLTDLVEGVVTEAMLIKPDLENSAATWGLYKTKDIPGYEKFNSGYNRYFQDAIDWLDKGIMDFIVPMVYWDIEDPLPNFDDLWLDFKSRTKNYKNIFPGMLLKKGWIKNGEIARQIKFVRENGGEGTVMFAIGAEKDNRMAIVKNIIYPQKVKLPENIKRTDPKQIYALDLNKLLQQKKGGEEITIDGIKRKRTDTNGQIGFIYSSYLDSMEISTLDDTVKLSTRFWQIPYDYIINKDSTVERRKPWVEMRRYPDRETNRSAYDFLFKTDYPAKAWINGDTAKVYKTGVFFDKVAFQKGANRVKAKIMDCDSSIAFYERKFNYIPEKPRSPYPLWVNKNTIFPVSNITFLRPDDKIRTRFQGSKGQRGIVKLEPGDIRLECERSDYQDFSIYESDIPFARLKKNRQYELNIMLKPIEKVQKVEELEIETGKKLLAKEDFQFPLVKTIAENSRLEYSLAKIRLGVPIIAEYPPGVVLKTIGETENYYKIGLSKKDEAFIHKRFVEEVPPNTPEPFYYIKSMLCDTTDSTDVLHIPYPEPVPYAIYPQPDQNRIVIALYGVKSSSTWLTHRTGRKYIEKITWEQAGPGVYKIYVNLKDKNIWGYDLNRKGRMLEFSVKHPPKFELSDKEPLKGIKIALEAGHGGDNFGAIGLSGIKEKDLNLDMAHKLADTLHSKGAEVLQVRDKDIAMSLSKKRDTVRTSDADLFISIHANAGGGGYLRVEGTSTYYNNPFWAGFADKVYKRLLELDLEEFGMVGSFNYKVTRITEMPSILVEQAFLSHAEDEEKLASQEFRSDMAQKIYLGILDYLKGMNTVNPENKKRFKK